MKRPVVISAAVILLGVAVWLLFFRGGTKKYEFRFDQVTEGDITMSVTATGTINAVITVEVGTQVSGIILKLYADFNSVVKEGQVIAQIDPTFLQQSVNDASASLERSQAQFADASRTLERTKSLFEKNLESQANYDASLTQFESAHAALKQAEATLKRARINLAYATIYAPIDGVVIDRKVNVGQTVAASFSSPTLYTIANDLRRMQVQATVDESDIGRISIGQEAGFTVDAYPDEQFTGIVSQIRLAPVSIQNVVNYTVVIDVDNDRLKLMPGMTANVKILVGSVKSVKRVSNLALRFQPPGELVDSAKVRETRGQAVGGEEGRPPERMEGRGDQGMTDRRERIRAIRDSIQASHGGRLSDDELRQEVRKVLGRLPSGGDTPPVADQSRTVRREPETRFGVQSRFPEYQKSAYVPARQVSRGRIWILNSSGKLEL